MKKIVSSKSLLNTSYKAQMSDEEFSQYFNSIGRYIIKYSQKGELKFIEQYKVSVLTYCLDPRIEHRVTSICSLNKITEKEFIDWAIAASMIFYEKFSTTNVDLAINKDGKNKAYRTAYRANKYIHTLYSVLSKNDTKKFTNTNGNIIPICITFAINNIPMIEKVLPVNDSALKVEVEDTKFYNDTIDAIRKLYEKGAIYGSSTKMVETIMYCDLLERLSNNVKAVDMRKPEIAIPTIPKEEEKVEEENDNNDIIYSEPHPVVSDTPKTYLSIGEVKERDVEQMMENGYDPTLKEEANKIINDNPEEMKKFISVTEKEIINDFFISVAENKFGLKQLKEFADSL